MPFHTHAGPRQPRRKGPLHAPTLVRGTMRTMAVAPRRITPAASRMHAHGRCKHRTACMHGMPSCLGPRAEAHVQHHPKTPAGCARLNLLGRKALNSSKMHDALSYLEKGLEAKRMTAGRGGDPDQAHGGAPCHNMRCSIAQKTLRTCTRAKAQTFETPKPNKRSAWAACEVSLGLQCACTRV